MFGARPGVMLSVCQCHVNRADARQLLRATPYRGSPCHLSNLRNSNVPLSIDWPCPMSLLRCPNNAYPFTHA